MKSLHLIGISKIGLLLPLSDYEKCTKCQLYQQRKKQQPISIFQSLPDDLGKEDLGVLSRPTTIDKTSGNKTSRVTPILIKMAADGALTSQHYASGTSFAHL